MTKRSAATAMAISIPRFKRIYSGGVLIAIHTTKTGKYWQWVWIFEVDDTGTLEYKGPPVLDKRFQDLPIGAMKKPTNFVTGHIIRSTQAWWAQERDNK